jgi:hypothetical protein
MYSPCTCGDFAKEVDTEKYIVEKLTGIFSVRPQVWGYPLQPRCGTELKKLRIDYILLPSKPLLSAGWDLGPVGLECKKSGEKIGPPLSQMMDYSRAGWDIRDGYSILLKYIFLFPMERQGGPIASLMAQNRLGGVEVTHDDRLKFFSGEKVMLVCGPESQFEYRATNQGFKAGSR